LRILSHKNGAWKEAYKVGGRTFKCFPPSTNLASQAEEFEKVEDAAVFLLRNPSWGIRMNPGSAIVYNNITISRD
jgi:hypothetical protein